MDVSAYMRAETARIDLYNHVAEIGERGDELQTAEVFGYDGVIIFARDVPTLKKRYSHLAFFFSPQGPSRLVGLKEPISGVTEFIMLRGGPEPINVLRALNDHRSTVFIHEFTHSLDHSRFKGDLFKNAATDDSAVDIPFDKQKYHNSPPELNAYFTEIAQPLLDRLAMMKVENDPELLGLYPDLPNTFDEFFKQRIRQLPIHGKKHLELLTEKNKRRLLSRLLALYNRVQSFSK